MVLAASVTMFGSNGDGSPKAKPRGASYAAEGGATFAGEATPARAAIPPAIPPRTNFKTSRRSTMNPAWPAPDRAALYRKRFSFISIDDNRANVSSLLGVFTPTSFSGFDAIRTS
jgi:hypothetical protein